ncbi:hypothetical protein [Pseudomonas sp. HMWF032]|uniref:hypothetical protein n=1 Tax=Pseudomonas sp. HMWF032 TaxID=2056866 RepID=UPI0011B27A7E|nr:hypothetical protein [Pseudomonas sp. HMWF032]
MSLQTDKGRLPAGHCHPAGHDMDVVKSLKPGKNGTKRFVERYGDDLIAVRYRHDAEKQISYTTVELIVERKHKPPKTRTQTPKQPTALVFVRVNFHEKVMQLAVKQAGGKWQPEEKAWLLSYKAAVELGLQERIINS